MNLETLMFDTMEVDTSLAKEFLDTHPELVQSTSIKLEQVSQLKGAAEDLTDKFRKLAYLIEINKDLFCQLDYIKRNKPVDITKNNDLKLLVNHLKYHTMRPAPIILDNSVQNPIIKMYDTTPLANLGWIVEVLRAQFKEPTIISSISTAAVCTLFKELCQKSGISILLEIRNLNLPPGFKDNLGSVVGIISRRSDIESAIDVFLNAPALNIWAINMIYVEESAIERFKQLIGSKTVQNKEMMPHCSHTYTYKNKVYLFESVQETDVQYTPSPMYIPIQTYRTVKDLLSLVKPSLCVSLWSSDVAESNEIATSLKSNIVWINDFGNFNGSPRTSQSYFSHLCLTSNELKTNLTPEIKELMKLRSEWLKKDMFVRRELVLDYLKGEEIFNIDDDFVDVGKNFLCVGKMLPVEIIYNKNEIKLHDVLRAIIRGSGVLYYKRVANDYYDYLVKINAPIVFLESELSPSQDGDVTVYTTSSGWAKTIWTSFGTIFAN